jgi:hypothetical protein
MDQHAVATQRAAEEIEELLARVQSLVEATMRNPLAGPIVESGWIARGERGDARRVDPEYEE